MYEYLKRVSKDHPVAVLIDPYMPQRDIVDYVKKMYSVLIKPIQQDYRKPNVKLGKVRRKNPVVKKRNEFIYQNRHLPKKEIVSLVSQKFGVVLDYTYVDKIIKEHGKK